MSESKPGAAAGGRYIDPHIHMSSRTTDDYQRMAAAGVVAVIEPAFWLGQPRSSVGSFLDYFNSLTGWERFRASQFGIAHYCTIGLNAKEANDERLADEVLELLGDYPGRESVRRYGPERIMANSSADWGVSNPLAVPQLAAALREAGFAEEVVGRVTYRNALEAFAPRDDLPGGFRESEWFVGAVDQRLTFTGNSVLRGQVPEVVDRSASQRGGEG